MDPAQKAYSEAMGTNIEWYPLQTLQTVSPYIHHTRDHLNSSNQDDYTANPGASPAIFIKNSSQIFFFFFSPYLMCVIRSRSKSSYSSSIAFIQRSEERRVGKESVLWWAT